MGLMRSFEDGGVIELTHSPSLHWMVAGPGRARVMEEFHDQQHITVVVEGKCRWILVTKTKLYVYTVRVQASFAMDVCSLLSEIYHFANPLMKKVLNCLSLTPRKLYMYCRLLSVHSLQRLHAVRKTKQLISSVFIKSLKFVYLS